MRVGGNVGRVRVRVGEDVGRVRVGVCGSLHVHIGAAARVL